MAVNLLFHPDTFRRCRQDFRFMKWPCFSNFEKEMIILLQVFLECTGYLNKIVRASKKY